LPPHIRSFAPWALRVSLPFLAKIISALALPVRVLLDALPEITLTKTVPCRSPSSLTVMVTLEVPLPVRELTVMVREASVPPPKEMLLLGSTDRLEEVAVRVRLSGGGSSGSERARLMVPRMSLDAPHDPPIHRHGGGVVGRCHADGDGGGVGVLRAVTSSAVRSSLLASVSLERTPEAADTVRVVSSLVV
jgi:hypothetical protein